MHDGCLFIRSPGSFHRAPARNPDTRRAQKFPQPDLRAGCCADREGYSVLAGNGRHGCLWLDRSSMQLHHSNSFQDLVVMECGRPPAYPAFTFRSKGRVWHKRQQIRAAYSWRYITRPER